MVIILFGCMGKCNFSVSGLRWDNYYYPVGALQNARRQNIIFPVSVHDQQVNLFYLDGPTPTEFYFVRIFTFFCRDGYTGKRVNLTKKIFDCV